MTDEELEEVTLHVARQPNFHPNVTAYSEFFSFRPVAVDTAAPQRQVAVEGSSTNKPTFLARARLSTVNVGKRKGSCEGEEEPHQRQEAMNIIRTST